MTGDRQVGRALGPYQLVALLGQGAMGAVYRARHTEVGVERAIKLLRPGTSAAGLLRFEREARNLARVRHPNVVQVHEADVEQGAPYLVMDLVAGRPLDEVLARGPLPLTRALALGADLARGVAALHEAGVVHRDLKPGNVLVRDDGAPVIVDLGVALAPDQDERLTRTGAMVGTPLYMAPEQLLGRAAGPPADVHALGLILFELTTGQTAVPAVSGIGALMAEVSERDRPTPSSVDGSLPAALDALVARALDRVPERRPHASALARDLDVLAASVAAGGAPSARAARWRRRVLRGAALALLAATGVLVGGRPTATTPPAATTPVPSATPPPSSPVAVARPDPEGSRQLKRAERIEDPEERRDAARDWLARWPDHPERPSAEALERRARALLPVTLRVPEGTLQARFLDDRRLVLASTEGLRIWDLDTRKALPRFTNDPAHGPLLVRPDGTILAATGPRCRVYEPGGRRVADLDLGDTVVSLASSSDGRVLVAGTYDGTVVVALPDGRVLAHLKGHPHPVWGVGLSPDGRFVVAATGTSTEATGPRDDAVRVWDLQAQGLAVERREELGNRGSSVVFVPRSGAFLVGTIGGRIFRFRVDRPGPEHEFTSERVQLQLGAILRPQAHVGGVHALVVSKDARRLWSVSNGALARDNELRAWDLETGRERYAFEAHERPFERIDLSPDETRLVTTAMGGQIELWTTD